MKKRIGIIRTAVVVLAAAVFGPVVGESQI